MMKACQLFKTTRYLSELYTPISWRAPIVRCPVGPCGRDRGPQSPLSGSLESHDSRFLAMFARTETAGFSPLLGSSVIAPN